MEQLIAKLIQDFEEGKTSRRQLIRTLSVAVGAASVAGVTPVAAAESAPLQAAGIDHISYQVADYAKTRDFYAGLLGMKVSADNGKQCNLAVGGLRIIARNGTGGTPKVDHIAYAIENWNHDAMMATLKERGFDPKPEGDSDLQLKDPDGFHVQLLGKK